MLLANIVGALVGGAWAALPVGLAMLAWGGFFIGRMSRLAVIAEEQELVVRNLFRTHHIPRSAIEGFRIGNPPPMMPFGKTIHVLVRDEAIVTADVFMASGLTGRGRRSLEARLQQLREWLHDGG
ncbi:MAG TPA: PH domain-containing protein [Acidimicrobiales bacterium]|nr:PH domain-containing protein [Acidimicrobiales bacterium]